MKIDIHVHTKRTKQGDAQTRNIDAKRFVEIIASTEVKIVAITNHNVFDLTQFNEFTEISGNDFQIWPGVELDIYEEDRKGHLLVIVSPKYAQDLEKAIKEVSNNKSPDEFRISIDDVISNFDKFNPLYIAHYKAKKPDLTDLDIEKIISKTKMPSRVLKEATNAISAGIFITHGHSSIYGSDIQDWSKYQSRSSELPDLRLPVESFEQFCLLLSKDNAAINTLLDSKNPDTITIKPFKDDKPFSLIVYDDINVFFGAKGTGKSDILTAIANYYANKGISAAKYEPKSEKLADIYDFGGNKLKIDLKDYNIDYCNKEIDAIRKSIDIDVTSLSKYRQYFTETLKNKKAAQIKIKDFTKENIQNIEREHGDVEKVFVKFTEFKMYLTNDISVGKSVDLTKLNKLINDLDEIIKDLDKARYDKFVALRSAKLFNNLIDKVKYEIQRKTGAAAKPNDTGFGSYSIYRIKLERFTKCILSNINKKISFPIEYVGNLDDKGDLHCQTNIFIQDGTLSDSEFKPLSDVNKKPQKEFALSIKSISKEIYTDKLYEEIHKLNSIDGVDTIPTILELLQFKKYFSINDKQYKPSTGESSMILLHKELNEDKDVYILDEPEKSLGNEYINNVILPLIKEKAKLRKKVFIATHDANIAVRTLPFNSIYRYHGKNGYETYIGNPFSNFLINLKDGNDKIDWKEVSMKTLEGGRNAFGERGQIYGNI